MYSPSWTSIPPPTPSHPCRLSWSPCQFSESYSKFPLAIYFTYGSVYVSIATLSICPTLSSPAADLWTHCSRGGEGGTMYAHIHNVSIMDCVCTHTMCAFPLLLLLLLSRFSRVRLCATPETAAHQAPPSLGFSRQEHWSRSPFPSPTHGSEKWKWSCSVVFDSLRSHGLQPTRLLHPWDFPGKCTGMGCCRGPAPVDPGNSKRGRHRRGSGNNCLIKC